MGNSIGTRFLDLGLTIGSSFSNELKDDEIIIQLYKFNESLTRLLSNQTTKTEIKTIFIEDEMNGVLDNNLLIKTFLNLLILKLNKIIEILKTFDKLSTIAIKLIEDILTKSISHKLLIPFHNLLMNRVQFKLSTFV